MVGMIGILPLLLVLLLLVEVERLLAVLLWFMPWDGTVVEKDEGGSRWIGTEVVSGVFTSGRRWCKCCPEICVCPCGRGVGGCWIFWRAIIFLSSFLVVGV